MALTKADIAEHLFTQLGMSKREAKDMVEAFFEEIRQALERGEQVKISGFGNFDLREKNQRPGTQPQDRRGYSYQCPSCGDLPAWPETQGQGRKC